MLEIPDSVKNAIEQCWSDFTMVSRALTLDWPISECVEKNYKPIQDLNSSNEEITKLSHELAVEYTSIKTMETAEAQKNSMEDKGARLKELMTERDQYQRDLTCWSNAENCCVVVRRPLP